MSVPVLKARTALAVAVAALVCSAAPAGAASEKPVHSKLTAADERDAIDVKFAEGSGVRLRGGHLVTSGTNRIPVIERFDGLRISRLFSSTGEEELKAARREAKSRSGREQDDMNLFFRIHTRGAADTVALLDALNARDDVELATPVSKPAPPPTASFVARQGYRGSAAAAGGIDADFAQALAGGKGENTTIVDLEYNWNRSHEDLGKLRAAGSALPNGTLCDHGYGTDHGTAVVGELAGDPNAFGVTGLATGATLRTVNVSRVGATGACEYNPANAIQVAADSTQAGDVILLEQQAVGPRSSSGTGQFGSLPLEWIPAVRTAIESATARGRIVIEAAGNGWQNLDDPVYEGRFATDSGAIMVGAGNAPGCVYRSDPLVTRGRLGFSNYGATVDLQGWGSCVTTAGYGDLQGPSGGDTAYTGTFDGTSSASPIVAAAAAIVSSIAEARGGSLKPAQVRDLLRSTGQPQQFGNAGAIGPLPNLRAAIAKLAPSLKESGHVISGSVLTGTTVPVRQSWTNSGSAAVSHEVWLSTDGGAWAKKSPTTAAATFDLEPGHRYQFAARAVDANGVWSDWAFGTEFRVDAYQEDYSSISSALTGTWTRAAWQPASGGFLSVSGTAGDRASFTFTGTNVAWIATKATNRGQARVSVDGGPATTIDLYAATTAPQSIAFSPPPWATSGTHTITVEVVGTAGRPKVDVDAFVRLR